MKAESGKKPIAVYAAMGGNFLIAVTKFIAGAISGSSAMISEGIHSLIDPGNRGLLLLGTRRSRKPADELHPFGHGKELYFWTLIVAILLFGIGGGLSWYEGIKYLHEPGKIGNPVWNYCVLGISFAVEGATWVIALRELLRRNPDRNLWRAVRASKEPTVFVVLVEDTAAMAGLIIGFLGVFLGHHFDNAIWDGLAAMVIGVILCTVAIFLIIESKGLIVGESADLQTVRSIREAAASDPAVAAADRPLTMHFGPDEVLLNIGIHFREELAARELAAAVDRIEKRIRQRHPSITRIFIEAEALKTKPDPGRP